MKIICMLLILQLITASTYCSHEYSTTQAALSGDTPLDTPCLLQTHDSTDNLDISPYASESVNYLLYFRRQDLVAIANSDTELTDNFKKMYNAEITKYMLDMLIINYPKYYEELKMYPSDLDINHMYVKAINSEKK